MSVEQKTEAWSCEGGASGMWCLDVSEAPKRLVPSSYYEDDELTPWVSSPVVNFWCS